MKKVIKNFLSNFPMIIIRLFNYFIRELSNLAVYWTHAASHSGTFHRTEEVRVDAINRQLASEVLTFGLNLLVLVTSQIPVNNI